MKLNRSPGGAAGRTILFHKGLKMYNNPFNVVDNVNSAVAKYQ